MTQDKIAARARAIVDSFQGDEAGAVLQCLSMALGMAVCYAARTKEDAIDMVNCIMLDFETDLPKRYDEVQKHLRTAKANGGVRA